MAELLVLHPITSKSASLMRMEIFTTTHLIICKPIIPIIQIYTMTTAINSSVATAEMTMMKEKEMTKMTPMNRQKMNKRLGVAGTYALIVIRKN